MAIEARAYTIVDCPKLCTMNVMRMPAKAGDLAHGWYEEGCNNKTIQDRLAAIGVRVSERAIARHRQKHLVPTDQMVEVHVEGTGEGGKVSDIDLLNMLIEKGGESLRLRGSRVSPEMALKAMELKYKLTQGNVFEDFMKAFAEVNEESIATQDEASEALTDPDEAGQAADDD